MPAALPPAAAADKSCAKPAPRLRRSRASALPLRDIRIEASSRRSSSVFGSAITSAVSVPASSRASINDCEASPSYRCSDCSANCACRAGSNSSSAPSRAELRVPPDLHLGSRSQRPDQDAFRTGDLRLRRGLDLRSRSEWWRHVSIPGAAPRNRFPASAKFPAPVHRAQCDSAPAECAEADG